ncbi:EF-P 5-aminopentanol modification-associated protein YfmF [Lacticaseibacillus hulanensis]|uniref:EF-P 5-aminopentanol modification-associated protein YfmF n=1 Tax=Lacticaseibacillus hulanensis TaxID=2493111 RepID=UPI000FD6FE4E|nr:pitrilysin family protein [Lacticaseibacillus hulanensis]
MRVKITDGVHLSVVPTTQFKTTRISVNFLAPLQLETIGARTLLTSLLEMSSTKYPTQAEFSAELENLYGASFGINVARAGRVHRVSAGMQILDSAYADVNLLDDAFAFLREALLNPRIEGGSFDVATFAREKTNLAMYLNSLSDDRATKAGLAVQASYFADPAQAVPSFGTADGLDGLTAKSLVATYQEMIKDDQIEIIMVGNVDLEKARALAASFGFAPRPSMQGTLEYDQPVLQTIARKTEKEQVTQSKLNLAYHIEGDHFGPQYYAALVACELFGGSPLSLLFRNVREKESLAYYASANANMMRHFMMVQAGIDAVNESRVEELIAAQLAAVVSGDFTDDHFQAIKDGMVNDRKASLDSQGFIADLALSSAMLPDAKLDAQTELTRINAVTREQVQAAAAKMKLQAVYFLNGEAH